MSSILIKLLTAIAWQFNDDGTFQLDTDTVHVWHIPIAGETLPFRQMLTNDEVKKADRFINQKNRNQFIVGRGAVRYLSAKYTGAPVAELVYDETEHQKPHWKTPHDHLHFNTAHSGDHVLICFGRSAVGVDIEKINERFLYKDVLERCFCKEEIESIEKSTDPLAAFYLLWTRKESLVKAFGTGINNDLPAVPCLDGMHSFTGNEWVVNSFELGEKNIATVAYGSQIKSIRYYELTSLSV